MDIIKFSIEKPVTVIVGVILVVMFGLVGLYGMPYQLSPSVIEPEIEVRTFWPGATPYEIEREIIEEQEKVLKGIPGLTEMESSSFNSRGTVTLRFKIGTVVDDALLRVSNKLNEVPSYPENVEKPVINATGAATSPVIWMMLKTAEGNPKHIYTYRTFFEDEVRQHIERVEGVADLFIGGGTASEMHVTIRPAALASYGLTVGDVIRVLQTENVNISAGSMGVGRREYRIRTVAEFKTPAEIGRAVLISDGQRRVTISDVAFVEHGYEKENTALIHNGLPGIAIGVKPEPGVNVLVLTDAMQAAVEWLNENKLKSQNIYIEWVYDQRPYIRGAIDLLRRNILIGGILAIIVLMVFLRSITSTIVAASAIPISVIGTFIFMSAMGRSLNVVSLAGIAFAVGMLVDSAIVVLENIDRHRLMGKRPFDAAYDGTTEVWGAILASTLTTVAVFLPVVFMEQEAGQLFKDIAIAVTSAITLSLFVSISVIPMLSRQLFRVAGRKRLLKSEFINKLGGGLLNAIMAVVGFIIKTPFNRVVVIVSLTAMTVYSAFALMPKKEYLPQGNRNLVINILIPPPGLSYEERKDIGGRFYKMVEPHIGKEHNGMPAIKNFFYVGAETIMLSGAVGYYGGGDAGKLVPMFMGQINSIPGMFGISFKAGIFQSRLGRGRTIEVDISGEDLNQAIGAAGMMYGMIKGAIPEAQIRPVPSLEILYPEVRFLPDRDRLKAVGMSAADFGVALDVLMDGRKVGEYREEGKKKVDLVLKASRDDVSTPEDLYRSLMATPGGKVVPVSSLSTLERTTGITEVRHLERRRTVTLQVTPPETMPLQEAMEIIDTKIIPAVREKGMLKGLDVRQSGVADKLTETSQALQLNFILAAAIAYLLMAALFGNFLYPLIIMFTVPLAAGGGVMGLRIVGRFLSPQPLDILTMLGFIILIGVVVNNAILIVHQALNNVRIHGMQGREAVLESTRTRLRPIYMSATTSIFAMLPLVVVPGPGSELYRGLGSVIIGGLALSTVFTVFIIPALLMFLIGMETPRGETAGNRENK